MILIRSLIKLFDRINEWAGRIFSWTVVILTLIVVYEVVTRRVFHSPHVWTYEIINLFYGAHFMLIAGYALLHHAHVSIDILYSRFPMRSKTIIDVVTYLLFFFPFILIMMYVGTVNASASWKTHELTTTARIPYVMPLMKTVTPVTALLLLIQGVSIFYRRIYYLTKGKEL